MTTSELLTKKVGPLPAYGWAAVAVVGGTMLYYIQANRKQAEKDAVIEGQDSTSLDTGTGAVGDTAFLYYPSRPQFAAGGQLYGDGTNQFSGTLPDVAGPGTSLVVSIEPPTTTPPGVDTGGGPPPTPAKHTATIPAGWRKGNTIHGHKLKGVVAFTITGTGKSKNGRYQIYRTMLSTGKRNSYHWYTSGKSKGKLVGPI